MVIKGFFEGVGNFQRRDPLFVPPCPPVRAPEKHIGLAGVDKVSFFFSKRL